ncbi:hypothetical protein [Adlercreutzia sp. ZJ141]|uniref:hypothetical protein n=1 Tax=Adlercreutzia sp. ZJ141 TaxID=2709406 RepID=UPI0013EAE82E|nr:hypothetical protein [Adlercreutzia sp. ZJ141]
MKNEKLYRKAIDIAADAEELFRSINNANKVMPEYCREKHFKLCVKPQAVHACTQQEFIENLFGVSGKRVMDDIDRVIKQRQERCATVCAS